MFSLRTTITALLVLFASSPVVADAVTVNDAWIREAPPVSKVQAAYATFKNSQPGDIEIISASSPAFNKIEFHETIKEGGLMKMRQQTSIKVTAKETTELKPEGMHLMLFNPVKRLIAGDNISIEFKLSDGRKFTSSFVVKKASGSDHHHHMHH